MKRMLACLVVAVLGYAVPVSATAITFEDFAPLGSLVNINPLFPYTEAGFTLRPTNAESAVFDSAALNRMLGNTSDWFGFAESNIPSLTLSAGGLFEFTGILAGPSTIASGIPINMTILGNVFGGSPLVANLNGLTTATPFLFNWTDLTSLTFITSDDAGLDNIQVSPVPEPATLLLLGMGLSAVAARRSVLAACMRRQATCIAFPAAMRKTLTSLGFSCLVLVASAYRAEAAPILLTNADFSSGLTGWTLFTTANGSLGPPPLPSTTSFDVNGDSTASSAATFQVGQLNFVPLVQAGGGIFQMFSSAAGLLSLSADIAAFQSSMTFNLEAGAFSMQLDGFTVAHFDFGLIGPGTIERSTLSAITPVTAGTHELRFLMTRGFLHSMLGQTPFQYIDDVTADIEATGVPEPATWVLLGTGLVVVAARRRLQRLSPSRTPRQGA